MHQAEQTGRAVIAASFCNFFWGLSFMASRIAMNKASIPVLLSQRFLIAFMLMSVILLTGRVDSRLREKPLKPLILLGLLQPVLYFIGEQVGLRHSTTIFSGVMISIIPIAGILAAIPALGEIPTARQMIFIIISLAGVTGIGLMSKNGGSLDALGVIGLIVAVTAAVLYNLLNRKIARKYSPFERTYIMMAVGAVVFTVMAVIDVKDDPSKYLRPLTGRGYIAALLYLGVLCSVVSFFLSNYAITRLSVARSTVFANLTTAVSVVAGALILHEPLTAAGVVCCVMIPVGIYGVQTEPDRRAVS